jgi:hypothetical protein
MMILKWLDNEYAVENLKWFVDLVMNFYSKIYALCLFYALRVSFVLFIANSVKGICSIVHNILLMVETGENKK